MIKVIKNIDIKDIFRLVRPKEVIIGKWRLTSERSGVLSPTAFCARRLRDVLERITVPPHPSYKLGLALLKSLQKECIAEKIFEPKIVYGLFPPDVINKHFNISLPTTHHPKTYPLQLVTLGNKIIKKLNALNKAGRYRDYFLLYGLAASTTEALANYSQKLITSKLRIRKKLRRISVGYPVWKDIKEQRVLCRMLGSKKIGVKTTETFQLVPEFSTSALIIPPLK